MRTSVSASTDDVASSSTSTSGSATPARSRATSWRSPADSCSPRSPTAVISPSGSAVDPVAERRVGRRPPPCRRATCPGGRSRRWRRSCRRTGTAPATRRRGAGAARRWRRRCSGTPPRRISPIVGSAKRAISRPSVVLPEPVAPTRATCWPAGMCDVDVAQHGLVDRGGDAPRRVGERDVARCRCRAARRAADAGRPAAAGRSGRSSTPSTRRSPATAVWVWSSTSVNSAIGSRKR